MLSLGVITNILLWDSVCFAVPIPADTLHNNSSHGLEALLDEKDQGGRMFALQIPRLADQEDGERPK